MGFTVCREYKLFQDIRIIMLTIKTAIFKHEGITQDNMETAEDLGVYLLKMGE